MDKNEQIMKQTDLQKENKKLKRINFILIIYVVISIVIQLQYVDIIGYQLFVVNTVEKWMCFLLAYGRKPRFNVFNLILQEKCEFEVAK